MYYKGAAAALLCCDLSGEREGGIERGREVRLGVGWEGREGGRRQGGRWRVGGWEVKRDDDDDL
jgi:hypothetical protein